MAEPEKNDAPLIRPVIVRALAVVALAAMAVLLGIDVVHGHTGHFGFDGFVGFYMFFGLLSGLVIIGVAKGLGVFVSRPDTYYDDGSEAAE